MYIVSACLLGENCKYDGGNNYNPEVEEFIEGVNYMALCPEEEGGLLTPRPPCEIRGDRVINKEGEDVTEEFHKGAEKALEKAEKRALELGETIDLAILRVRSPSCGKAYIYDGNFSGNLIPGNGIFASKLKENNILLISEEETSYEKSSINFKEIDFSDKAKKVQT